MARHGDSQGFGWCHAGTGQCALDGLLKQHNEYRANHGAPPLVWDNGLAANAQRQADTCQQRNMLFHGNNNGEGQNVFMAFPAASGAEATDAWYSEIQHYDFGSHRSRGGEVGHFTQVVWYGSQRVGAAASANGQFIVANYSPAGNFMGQEPRNVFGPQTDMASAAKARQQQKQQPQMDMQMSQDGFGQMDMGSMMQGMDMQGFSSQGFGDMPGFSSQGFGDMPGFSMQGFGDMPGFGQGFGGMQGLNAGNSVSIMSSIDANGNPVTIKKTSVQRPDGTVEVKEERIGPDGQPSPPPAEQRPPIGLPQPEPEPEPEPDRRQEAADKFQAARAEAKSRPSASNRIQALEEALGLKSTGAVKGLMPRLKRLEEEVLGEPQTGKLNERIEQLEQCV